MFGEYEAKTAFFIKKSRQKINGMAIYIPI
nr:MAG TPA: hypothetical protein [Caudoviricetes sp.]